MSIEKDVTILILSIINLIQFFVIGIYVNSFKQTLLKNKELSDKMGTMDLIKKFKEGLK